MAYRPRSLFSLIEEINRSIFLPHIQRPFVWEMDQLLKFFDSLMRSYPIQTFLFWRTKEAIKARKFMDPIRRDPVLSDYYDKQVSAKDREKIFVLDGQQRLQSLYAIFAGSIELDTTTTGDAYFDISGGHKVDEDGLAFQLTFASSPPSDAHYRVRDLRERHERRNAEEIADELNKLLDAKLSESEEEKSARQRRVRRNAAQLSSILKQEQPIWIEQLDGVAQDYPYKTILDIFVRVNSGGTRLDPADLMFAVMKEEWEDVEENIEDVTGLLSNEGRITFDKSLVLKCLVIAHGLGAELTPDKLNSAEGGSVAKTIEENWPRAEAAFQQLRDFMTHDLHLVSDKMVRSYGSFVPLFDFLFHNPKPDEASRQLMRAYYYKAQLFNWYRAQTDTVLNVMHNLVGKEIGQFPIAEIKQYFAGRGSDVELSRDHVRDPRLRFIILNLVYVEQFGASPFDVAFKGNEPHVDHIYPKSPLSNDFGLSSDEINHNGNYRFVGAADNVRKRAEKPDSYFVRLKRAGVPVEKHLLLAEFAENPALLKWDEVTYHSFRDERLEAMWEIASKIVNAELP